MQVDTSENIEDFRCKDFKGDLEKAWYIACNHFALLVAIAGGLAACAFASIRITESFFYHHLAAMGVLICPPVYFGYVVYFSNWLYPQVSWLLLFFQYDQDSRFLASSAKYHINLLSNPRFR